MNESIGAEFTQRRTFGVLEEIRRTVLTGSVDVTMKEFADATTATSVVILWYKKRYLAKAAGFAPFRWGVIVCGAYFASVNGTVGIRAHLAGFAGTIPDFVPPLVALELSTMKKHSGGIGSPHVEYAKRICVGDGVACYVGVAVVVCT